LSHETLPDAVLAALTESLVMESQSGNYVDLDEAPEDVVLDGRFDLRKLAKAAEEAAERVVLLRMRSFIATHGVKEADTYCMQRLHDMAMDARHRAEREKG
jgi:hypothetical protein